MSYIDDHHDDEMHEDYLNRESKNKSDIKIKNFFKTQWEMISKMSSMERNGLLCQLAAKDYLKTIMPHEFVQMEIIQTIRRTNGEIDRVLKNWEENPELDPRN